jgi:membrane protease YdiL (CAAX protease family)
MIGRLRHLADSASPLAFFAACLGTTIAFRAGPLVAEWADLALWSVLPEALIRHWLGRLLIRGSAVTAVALVGLFLPLLVSSSRKADEIEAAASATRARGGPTPFQVLVLVFGLQFLPLLAVPARNEGDQLLLGAYVVIAVVVVAGGRDLFRPSARMAGSRVRGRLPEVLAGPAIAITVAVGTLLCSFAIDRTPGPPVTTPRSVQALILSPVILEFTYRAGVQRILTGRAGSFAAILGAGLCYALYHDRVWEFFEFMAFSMLVGIAYSLSGRLLVAVVAHSLTNVGELLRDRFMEGVFRIFPRLGPPEGVLVAGGAFVVILLLARAAGYRGPPPRESTINPTA